ncbi:gamma carbonic anhydrase family protein [uncultured Sulfitobacter sp.]|uniref:gamma carbonic anhydrase family protein n=1 Tax=uncultured Sulfitobacter sp. TaxID=191468 RepID=UPI00262DA325|nr:gamma carbonic anhydrase family protein [uncultured Sulfitobacter sp.]
MPHLGPDVTATDPALIHDTALLYGKVTLGKGVSIWPYVVTRAEMHEIKVGERTNIQDHVMIHVGYQTPTIIGSDCSITHRAILHGCEIADRVLIGIGATVMDGAKIGSNSIVAGHSIITEGTEFPENSIIAGSPAKLIRTRDNSAANIMNAKFYLMNAQNYANGIERLSPEQLKALQSDA